MSGNSSAKGVAGGQDQSRAFALLRADRPEDVGRGGALVRGALGREPRLAQRRVILFFWPIRASSANQISSLIGRSGSSAQTIHHSVSMSLTGSCFSSGISAKALPAWDSRTRWNNLSSSGLAVSLNNRGPRNLTNSPHPSSREGHHSTAWWISSFLLSHFILHGSHAGSTSRLHRNSVPSTHMRCMITANRRASATIAFFIPRCLAIFIAQALSQDHLVVRVSMLWAAS